MFQSSIVRAGRRQILLAVSLLWCITWLVPSADAIALARPVYKPFTVDSDLRIMADVTGAQLDKFMRAIRPSSPLIGLGTTWVSVGKQHRVNAIFLMALAIHESAWGTSRLARTKHNIYGWGARDGCPRGCATAYSSKGTCIKGVVPRLTRSFLTPGGRYFTRHGATLRGINVRYASDRQWKHKVLRVMNRAGSYIHKHG